MYALLSVHDKTGIVELGRKLSALGYGLLSTGGTARELAESGLDVIQVGDFTGDPEILEGRVKTLHPKIHAGILNRRSSEIHKLDMERRGYAGIGVVVVNFYPFERVASDPSSSFDEVIENIDIGGPTMVRAAAKNFQDVVVLVSPSDYGEVETALDGNDDGLRRRQGLARKAFEYVSEYDSAITSYMANRRRKNKISFPKAIGESKRGIELRYGENPHQRAFLYRYTSGKGVANAKQIQGGEMSYLNYLDADAAWEAVAAFSKLQRPACVIVKHASPCGMAVKGSQTRAFWAAFACDKTSAYGGIIAFNRKLTADTATAMKGLLLDVIVAPGYEVGALEILKRRKRARILVAKRNSVNSGPQIRSIGGGALVQESDRFKKAADDWKVVPPFNRADIRSEIWNDLKFAWLCCRSVKSNAVVLVKGGATIGIGGGQPNRVKCVELAVKQAGEQARGAVLASDAFFPFADGVELAARAGVKAVIHPGGSIRDEEVAEAANKYMMAMVLTGERHFLH